MGYSEYCTTRPPPLVAAARELCSTSQACRTLHRERSVVQTALALALAQEFCKKQGVPFFEASAKTGNNVDTGKKFFNNNPGIYLLWTQAL